MVSVKGTGKWSIPAMRQVPRKKLASVSAMVSRILGMVSTFFIYLKPSLTRVAHPAQLIIWGPHII